MKPSGVAQRIDGGRLLEWGSAAVFEAPTGVAGLDDIAVMGEPVSLVVTLNDSFQQKVSRSNNQQTPGQKSPQAPDVFVCHCKRTEGIKESRGQPRR